MRYPDFASTISFYEFIQDEFKHPHFKPADYEKEIRLLDKALTIERLANELGKAPKLFDVLEELFQLDHFTDAQYIHFCFDVNKLNNSSDSLLLKYITNRVLKFENGEPNAHFNTIYDDVSAKYPRVDTPAIFFTKRTIIKYVTKLLDRRKPNKRKILYDHLANSIETRLRVATYLIENLNALDLFAAVDVRAFLRQKRHPIDTKGLRGRFGITKISRILQDGGFANVTDKLRDKTLSPHSPVAVTQPFSFVTERCVAGILKRSNKKLKKFDFVVLHKGLPKILIETNFYSTSGGGTKIGINENEYTALSADIHKFNKAHGTNLSFMWITDGNYWLSSGGESRFTNLKANFFKGPLELLNFNLLRRHLPEIKKSML